MKILIINKFLYPKGGDAISALNTGALLKSKGHEVHFWGMQHLLNPPYPFKDLFVSNTDFDKPASFQKQLRMAMNLLYSVEAKRKISQLLKRFRPNIIHLNNFAHQISPSILHVFKKYGIPCVMTMHDYKLVCPTYRLLRNQKICELCKNRLFYNCFLTKCSKGSVVKSLISIIEMYLHHNVFHIYDLINVFISPSRFLVNKMHELGFKRKIEHLPNFVNTGELIPSYGWEGKNIVYVGRLSLEKGILTLIEAMKGLNITLNIIGEGNLEKNIRQKLQNEKIANVKMLGYKTREELKNIIMKSMFVVMPSEWYENNPLAIVEAFGLGKPVLGSNMGGIPELVKDGETGLTFRSGDIKDLRNKINELAHTPNLIAEMGKKARKFVENNLNEKIYCEKLIKIYESLIDNKNHLGK